MNFINAQPCSGGCGNGGGVFGGLQSLMQTVVAMLIGLLTGGLLGNLMRGQSGNPMTGGGGYPGVGFGGGSPNFGGGGFPGPAGGMGQAANNFLGGSPAGSGGGYQPTGPVAPGVEGMLGKARSMLGLEENRDRAAIQSVTGKSGINPSTTPWCAAFAMNMLKDHGVLDTSGLSNPNYCPTIKNWASGKGIWGSNGRYTPKPGDAILFDWQKDGTSDHIGIVEKVENGMVTTIEGNSSNSVKRNTYPLGSSKIDGYVVTGRN